MYIKFIKTKRNALYHKNYIALPAEGSNVEMEKSTIYIYGI